MFRLQNSIQNYEWGSCHAIAEMQGREATGIPEAELWLGAHPKSPSRIARNGQSEALDRLVAEDPEYWLGRHVAKRFSGQFPFLLKALAAVAPLSLQAHPSIRQAIEGYEREDHAGIPANGPERNYHDRNHKPELICALSPFDALCGFRRVEESRELFKRLAVREISAWTRPLYDLGLPPERAVQETFGALMLAPKEAQSSASHAVAIAASELLDRKEIAEFEGSLRWAVRLSELYPGDIGVPSSLLLNQLRLRPGDALYLPAGRLHSYLEGFGIEIMANSDNVLRGGCTPKHVDVPELMRVLEFACGPVDILRGDILEPGIRVYRTPAPDFELSAVDVRGRLVPGCTQPGPQLLLVARGAVRIENAGELLELGQGQSAFVRPEETGYALVANITTGATVYRATVGALE